MADIKLIDVSRLTQFKGLLDAESAAALLLKADKSDTYTKSETDARISAAVADLVDGAPDSLNTLKELADALADTGSSSQALLETFQTKTEAQAAVATLKSEIIGTADSSHDTLGELADLLQTHEAYAESTYAKKAELPDGAWLASEADVQGIFTRSGSN